MYPICNYTGPTHSWNLPLNGFAQPVFFPPVAGCCSMIKETSFPKSARAFLGLLFEQIGADNQTITSFTRHLQKPKTYSGLPGSQVTLQVQVTYYEDKPITGTQQYVNCTDAQNIVKNHEKQPMSVGAIIGIMFGSFIGLGLLCGCFAAISKECSFSGYRRI